MSSCYYDYILTDDGLYPDPTSIEIEVDSAGSTNIKEVITSFIEDLISFSETYNDINYNNVYKCSKIVNVPLEDITPDKYSRGIVKERIEETIVKSDESIFSYILKYFESGYFPWMDNNSVHVIRHIYRDFDVQEPLIFPLSEVSVYYEPCLLVPNWQKKFWLLTNENISAYQLHSFDNLLPIMADLLSSYILLKYETDYKFTMSIIIAFSALFQSKETLKYFINNSSYSGLDEIKNDDEFFDMLYDKLEDLGRTNQLIRHIVNNYMNTVMDLNISEVLEIIGSKTNSEIESKLSDIKQRFSDAKTFMKNNNLPRIEVIDREKSVTIYEPCDNGILVTEHRETKTERPMNIVHNSSQSVISRKEYMNMFSTSLLSRKIIVKNGSPVRMEVNTANEDYIKGVQVTYQTDSSEITLGGVYEVSTPTTSWDDAVNLSNTIQRIMDYEKYNKTCRVIINNINQLEYLTSQLIENTYEFSLSYNSDSAEITVSLSGIRSS